MKQKLTGLLSFTFPFTCIHSYSISFWTRTKNDVYGENLAFFHAKEIKMSNDSTNQITSKRIKTNMNIQNQISPISTTCIKSKTENSEDANTTVEDIQYSNGLPPNLFEMKRIDEETSQISKRQMISTSSCSPLNQCIRLNNGNLLPVHGFGTYKMQHDLVEPLIKYALQVGYRLIDTAHVYKGGKTEGRVGNALQSIFETNTDKSNSTKQMKDTTSIESSTIKSKSILQPFVMTKVWRSWHGYEDTKICLRRSLKRLQMDQVDLVLIHWPGPGYKTISRSHELIEKYGVEYFYKEGHEQFDELRLETWRALEDSVLITKQCRSIGVSNFSIQHLQKLLNWKSLRIMPAVNQIEMHPYFPQTELREFCHANGIAIQAYSSLGGQDSSSVDYNERLKKPPLLENPVVLGIAKDTNKTCAQVLLRWAIQHGAAIIPKASSEERILENSNIYDFTLSKSHMDALDALDCGPAGRLAWRRDPMRDLMFD